MWTIVGFLVFLSLTIASASDVFHFPNAKHAWWETGVFGILTVISVGYLIALVA